MLSLFLLLAGLQAHAAPVAPTVPGGLEPGLVLRAFGVHDDFSLMAEGIGRNETDGRNVRELTVGGYFQPWSNLKFGAFYRRAYGLRHDDDWDSDGGVWQWESTNSRGEDFFILDVSPRAMLSEHLIGEFKTRYSFNFFNGERTLMVRPGLSYFLLSGGEPFLNFFAQAEFDLPSNYGARTVYEEWVYAGALYHLRSNLEVGGVLALKWQTWGSSYSYLDKGGAPYVITTETTALNAVLIYQFNL